MSSESWEPPIRRFAAIGLLAVLIGLIVFFLRREAAPPAPEVELSNLDPALAERIHGFRQTVESDPRSGEAWGELGMMLHANGFVPQAVDAYRQAVRLEPEEFRWSYLLAHALRKTDPDAAREELERALELDPDYEAARALEAELSGEKAGTGPDDPVLDSMRAHSVAR